jgi:uncharacterized protein YjbJ (UPF0337 family)/ElaB/YqjD/DUF883 family membrane-anchored ribosome-binding protein
LLQGCSNIASEDIAMEENRTAGVLKNGAGKIEGGAGEVTGDMHTKIEGKVDQGVGKVQSVIGSAIDLIGAAPIADRAATLAKQAIATGEKATWVVQDAAQKVGAQAADIGARVTDGARTFSQSLVQYVEERPLTSALIAAALGYGLARLLHAERRLPPIARRSVSGGSAAVTNGDSAIAMPLGAV